MDDLVQELKRTIGRELQMQGIFGVEVIVEYRTARTPSRLGLAFDLKFPESFSEEQKRKAGEIASRMVNDFLTSYGHPE
jgi:hypothetical protein